ncbi:hypothetical protein LTR36_006773 [Oleoguttula mirabilis]|uniref:Clathrin light chain n=1 Tax=Oleoguttula mirabilis TaxID=1507867 RepID=A0AAV9JC27_9PEZI|nr:hypothetical protein LTR36_006773 [Oleoguttula mirabilis]
MADRFPSLDDFDAGQTEAQGPSAHDALDSDEPSDFLARERAALGADAHQFATPTDNTATVQEHDDEDDDDLLGGGGGHMSSSAPTNGNSNTMDGDDMMGDFESSFPAVDTQNNAVAPGGTITGSTLPYRPSTTTYGDADDNDDGGEPTPVREWRERRTLQLQHRDELSSSKKSETVKAAQEAIDEFYDNYNNRKDKQIAQTRKEAEEYLKNREDTTSGGTSWERISKLVDLSGKGSAGGAAGTGKSKMREMLVSLRKDEKAPGATGY